MTDLYPSSRIEEYISAIINGYKAPSPINRVDYYLAKIAGENVDLPDPIAPMDFYLAKLCGEDVDLPDPSSRTDFFLAKLCGEDVETPVPNCRLEEYFDKWIAFSKGNKQQIKKEE